MTFHSDDGGFDLEFTHYDAADEDRRESLFSLGNGWLLHRAALPGSDADGRHYPGLYRAGLYDRRQAEVDGQRIDHDSLVNLPDPLRLRLRLGDEWLELDRAEVLRYRQALDTRHGVALRETVFRCREGSCVSVRERRLVSLARPRCLAMRLEVTVEGGGGPVLASSALSGAVWNGNAAQEAPGRDRLLDVIAQPGDDVVVVQTRQRRVRVAVARRVEVTGGAAQLAVETVAAVTTSRDPGASDPEAEARAELSGAPDFAALEAEQAAHWAALWASCPIATQDERLGRALRFNAFHLLQTVSAHTDAADAGFPARGWQEGYFGHVFWDQTFAVSFFAPRWPALARSILLYRCRRLAAAKRAARAAGLEGAMFPWRSATSGEDETPPLQPNPLNGQWLADYTCLQRHVGAIIVQDVLHYHAVTGDETFLLGHGAELVVEIARFWASAATTVPGSDRLDLVGVVGPDEYHTVLPGEPPGLRGDAYTNVMAAWTLRRAAELLRARAGLRRRLGVDTREMEHWTCVAARLRLVFHDDGVLSQFEGYAQLAPLDLGSCSDRPGRLDLALAAQGRDVNAYQIAKQADVLMLLHLLRPAGLAREAAAMGYTLTLEQMRRTAAFYADRTVHDSSLSLIGSAGALAPFDPGASWTLFCRSLAYDEEPGKAETVAQGLHLGAMAGVFEVLARLYLGLDYGTDELLLTPDPSPALPPVGLGLCYRGNRFTIGWDRVSVSLCADAGNQSPLPVRTSSEAVAIAPGQSPHVPVRTWPLEAAAGG